MSPPNENESFVTLEGDSYTYTLYRFPLTVWRRSLRDQLLTWREMLAWIESAEQVAEALRQQAELIEPDRLKPFARRLLGIKPIGVLSAEPTGFPAYAEGRVAPMGPWLVVSNHPEAAVCRAIPEGGWASPRMFFLERILIPRPPRFPKDDIVLSFFWWFGGLRDAPPGFAGFFNRWPQRLTEIIPDDSEMYRGTMWQDAKELYTAANGDRLVVSREGRVGWRLHAEDLRIVPGYDSLDQALEALLAGDLVYRP